MPTYQYACTNPDCGDRFELVQSFTDDAVTECPVCGERVRKVFGSVGVVFKGSGFYRTDSRDGAKTSSTTASSTSDASSSGSSSDSASSTSTSSTSGESSSSSTSTTTTPASKPAAAAAS